MCASARTERECVVKLCNSRYSNRVALSLTLWQIAAHNVFADTDRHVLRTLSYLDPHDDTPQARPSVARDPFCSCRRGKHTAIQAFGLCFSARRRAKSTIVVFAHPKLDKETTRTKGCRIIREQRVGTHRSHYRRTIGARHLESYRRGVVADHRNTRRCRALQTQPLADARRAPCIDDGL